MGREHDRSGQLQLFCLVNRGVPPPFDTIDETGLADSRNLAKGVQNPQTWWILTATPLEVLRTSVRPLRNLSLNEITQHADRVRHSVLRLRIGWTAPGFGHEIDLDLGSGVRLGIESCTVDVAVLGPAGRTAVITKGVPVQLGDGGVGGIYSDTVVSATLTPSTTPPSARRPTLSQTIERRRGASVRAVPIPPFARALQITRRVPDMFPAFEFVMGAGGPSIRTFNFDPADPGATFRVPIPQLSTHVLLGAALPGSNSAVTLIWELDL